MRLPLSIFALIACACGSSEPASPRPDPLAAAPAHGLNEPIQPLPAIPAESPAKVALGQRLFVDPRLSGDGTISCATCHVLAAGGDDDRTTARGIGGASSEVNTPTVFNASLNFRQFWDGRVFSLEEQVDGPLEAAAEMGSSWPAVLAMLGNDAGYRRDFVRVYGGMPTPVEVRDAIATFERTLVRPGGRFDRWLAGDASALDADEKSGYQLFKTYGCVSCHQGANVGGNMFETFGATDDYFADRPERKVDQGRFNVTGKERDRHVFKVPSLRLATLTGPYFHDGSAATLDEAIAIMGRYQLGIDIPPSDRALIERFLATLVGPWEGAAR